MEWLIYTACDLIIYINQQQIMRDCDKISHECYFMKAMWWEIYTWESLSISLFLLKDMKNDNIRKN